MILFQKLLLQNRETTAGIVFYENKRWFFKISNKIDFLMKHEFLIYNDCVKLKKYCDNFPRRAKLIQINATIDFYKKLNPFEHTPGEKIITIDCLLTEYIKGKTLAAAAHKLSPPQFKSIISQLMIALKIAAGALNFTHYDLHPGNIILKKIEEGWPRHYIFKFNDKIIEICARDFIPIIVDFSYSYSRAVAGENLCANLSLTNVNYIPIVSDYDVDIRSLLPGAFSLKRIILNYPSVTDYILFSLNETKDFSSYLFENNRYACIDIIKYLIVLPVRERNYTGTHVYYGAAADEFKKIEDISSCAITNLVILKYIVNEFSNSRPFEQQKQDIFSFISSFGKFHYPKSLDLIKLKESLISLSECIEGIIYEYLSFSLEDIESKKKSAGEINQIVNEFIV